MAKVLTVKKMKLNGLETSQEFNEIRSTIQVGDRFFVPMADMLMILGTSLEGRDVPVAQYFPAVKLDADNNPVSVQNLYIGQIVKLDVNRQVAFNNELYKALSTPGGSAKFKNLICGKVLEVTESKEILDRVWDNEKVAWKRNADETFVSQKKIAFRFEPKNLPNAAVATAATNKLMEHYESDPICKEFINVDEAE